MAYQAATPYLKRMKRFVLGLVATILTSSAAVADAIPLRDISRYFNSFETAQAKFTQVNADGTLSTGTLYIQRPGRVRFEYDPPDDALVMAGGGSVAIFDAKSNQPPEQYPLKRTPLNIILQRQVNLESEEMVVGYTSDDTTTTVVAQDPENADAGTLQLVFTGDPVQLRKWVITDGGGSDTTVILGELALDVQMSQRLFSIPFEIEDRLGD